MGNQIITIEDESGLVMNLVVRNYDDRFGEFLDKIVHAWHTTNDDFEEYVLKRLKEACYDCSAADIKRFAVVLG